MFSARVGWAAVWINGAGCSLCFGLGFGSGSLADGSDVVGTGVGVGSTTGAGGGGGGTGAGSGDRACAPAPEAPTKYASTTTPVILALSKASPVASILLWRRNVLWD